jgi:hypothetical protein
MAADAELEELRSRFYQAHSEDAYRALFDAVHDAWMSGRVKVITLNGDEPEVRDGIEMVPMSQFYDALKIELRRRLTH